MHPLLLRLFAFAALVAGLALAGAAALSAESGRVLTLRIDGVIGPATADYVHRGLERGAQSGAALVVIEMDTPGGLDSSMRTIIKDILASPVPVASFVSPEGARAASAGTYILYASHVAAMAPATNLGAATPVAIGIGGADRKPPAEEDGGDDKNGERGKKTPPQGDAMSAKAVNDAAAYIRSLAQLRGRNADFAAQAVLEAASLSSDEALKAGVIDLLAHDVPDLLQQLDGREIALAAGKVRLATANAAIEHQAPDWRNRILSVLANPQLALILMMIGIYGLFFEFTSPGFGVPGVAGAISLLIALYAFQLMPVNWAGVALIAIGAALMLAEAFAPSFGVLGIGGLIAFVVGGLFLLDAEAPGFGIPLVFIFGLAAASLVILLAVGTFAARSFRRPVVSGREEMVGSTGTVIAARPDGTAWVRVHGESWSARSATPLALGQTVRVTAIDGLTLEVDAVEAAPPAPANN